VVSKKVHGTASWQKVGLIMQIILPAFLCQEVLNVKGTVCKLGQDGLGKVFACHTGLYAWQVCATRIGCNDQKQVNE